MWLKLGVIGVETEHEDANGSVTSTKATSSCHIFYSATPTSPYLHGLITAIQPPVQQPAADTYPNLILTRRSVLAFHALNHLKEACSTTVFNHPGIIKRSSALNVCWLQRGLTLGKKKHLEN